MARKAVEIYWFVIPVPLILLSLFLRWRYAGGAGPGLWDSFQAANKPAEFAVAKVALIGGFAMLAGVVALFLTKGTNLGAVVAALVGVCSAVFIAVGVTAYTDLQGPTGADPYHIWFGMPCYVLGAIATLLLAVQTMRSAPGVDGESTY
jgi:hypothetical protein